MTADVEETIGGNVEAICEAGGCVEALLDIEYIEAVANPIPLTVIYSSTCKRSPPHTALIQIHHTHIG